MHFRYFRDFRAFRFMAFARSAFFGNEISGGLGGFGFGKMRGAGRFRFCFAGGGLFGLCGGFLFFRLAGGFFLRSVVFARCVFCTAECRACSEALAAGVNESVVNSKAQSVIEILVIRATGQSPDKCGSSIIPACDLQSPSILIYKNPGS